MEGLQMGVMTETQTSIIAPNASLPANPLHANQTPGSHGGADSRCRTDHEVENSAITPSPTIAAPEVTNGRGAAKLWRPCTPAMAAGLTDHVWTLREVLLFRVPPWPQPQTV